MLEEVEEEKEKKRREKARKALLLRGVRMLGREASQAIYAAGQALDVPSDWTRTEHVLHLLRQGDDVLAEDMMVQVEASDLLATPVLQLLRRRLARTLNGLRSSGTKSAQILAALDADTSEWVLAAAGEEGEDGEGGREGANEEAAAGIGAITGPPRPASLAGTHNLLLQLQRLLSPTTAPQQYKQIKALANLCAALLQAGREGGREGENIK